MATMTCTTCGGPTAIRGQRCDGCATGRRHRRYVAPRAETPAQTRKQERAATRAEIRRQENAEAARLNQMTPDARERAEMESEAKTLRAILSFASDHQKAQLAEIEARLAAM